MAKSPFYNPIFRSYKNWNKEPDQLNSMKSLADPRSTIT